MTTRQRAQTVLRCGRCARTCLASPHSWNRCTPLFCVQPECVHTRPHPCLSVIAVCLGSQSALESDLQAEGDGADEGAKSTEPGDGQPGPAWSLQVQRPSSRSVPQPATDCPRWVQSVSCCRVPQGQSQTGKLHAGSCPINTSWHYSLSRL